VKKQCIVSGEEKLRKRLGLWSFAIVAVSIFFISSSRQKTFIFLFYQALLTSEIHGSKNVLSTASTMDTNI